MRKRLAAPVHARLDRTWTCLWAAITASLGPRLVWVWSRPPVKFSTDWWTLVLTTLIAVCAAVSFSVGHTSYLKVTYTEDLSWLSARPDRTKRELYRRANWDTALMFLIAGCQVGMAWTLNSVDAFLSCYNALMLADLLYLAFEPRTRTVGDFNGNGYAPRRWMWTNLATSVLIMIAPRVPILNGMEMCVTCTIVRLAVAVSNRILDLYYHNGAPVKPAN